MRSSFIKDTRGAAMVEGVIVFPLFIVVFAAILHYHQAYSLKLERSNKARSCAFTYSVSGCRKIPEGCPAFSKIGEENFSDIEDGLGDEGQALSKSVSSSNSKIGSALGGTNSLLVGLLGLREGIVARPSGELKLPSVLGGGTRRISGNYSVMCNERNHTFIELVEEIYCAVGKGELPGCDP